MNTFFPAVIRAGALASLLALGACGADGDLDSPNAERQNEVGAGGTNNPDDTTTAGIIGSDASFPNDGSVGGSILQNGVVVAGDLSNPAKGFVCTQSASFNDGAYLEVGANGLVGGLLGGLLQMLSGDSVDNLLNSVSDSVLAIDGDLGTVATVTQTLSGLAGVLNSMEIIVNLPDGEIVQPGRYAVYAVSFPSSLLELGLLSNVTVQTFLGDMLQETGALIDTSSLSLLGVSTNQLGLGHQSALVGYKTTKPYNRAQLSIGTGLLSIDIGDKLNIHEFCTDGDLVAPPA